MQKVVTYNNILNPTDRTIYSVAHYENSEQILKDLKYDNTIYDLVISKNSIIQDGFFEVKDGDIVNITIIPKGGGGGGKKIVGMVAMIALAVASAGAAAAWGATVGSALGVSAAMGGALVGIGVSLVGGLLLSAIMPRPNNTFDFNKQDFKNSQTYSWGVATNQSNQGQAIPKIFGKHKITPPLISSYIEVVGEKQYFNGLYALNDGAIKSVSSIKINNENIENYKNVSYEIRKGENNQTVIKNFNDTHYDKPVNKKLNADKSYTVAKTDGNAVTQLKATLVMPKGLWYANDSGGLSNYSINVSLEYSPDGQSWSSFTKDSITITANDTATLRKTFKVTNLTPSQYSVRAKFNTTPQSSSRYGSDCYLEYITETTSDDFIYPKTALLSIKAMATDQLSGNSPTVSCIVDANSSNPALICKQILLDSGVDSSFINSSFNEWERYCNEKNLKCNIVFDSEISVRKALDTVSLIGRASVLQMGSKFDCIIDKAYSIPVQSFMFGMGNILKDSFKQSFLPLIDRANLIEITYYDEKKEYEPTIVTVTSKNYNKSKITNKTSVTLVGCTNKEQALRYGNFLLNCNKYLTQTVEFEAHKDSLVCRYGDIVKVSHDVPEYGYSGRLVKVEGNILTLDRDIEFDTAKTYAIQIKNELNEIKEYEIEQILSSNKISVNLGANSYTTYDNYSLGEVNQVTKLFRIIKISTSSEFTRHITALEYNEDVYNDNEIIEHQNISSIKSLSNLRVQESLKLDSSKTIVTYLNIAFNGSSLSYNLKVQNQRTLETKNIKLYDSFALVQVEDNNSYLITVSDNAGNSLSTTHNVLGKLEPPEAVTNINVKEYLNEYELSLEYTKPIDFKHFEIYKDGVLEQTTTNFIIKIKKDTLSSYINIVAVDTSNIRSKAKTLQLNATPPSDVSSFRTLYIENKLHAYWESIGDLQYEIRKGESFETAFFIASTKDKKIALNFTGTYLIKSYYENIYGLKVYSNNEQKLIVDENRLDLNVMETITQPNWIGTHNSTQIANNGLCLIGDYTNSNINLRKLDALEGSYDIAKKIVLNSEKSCQISAFMDVSGLVLNSSFDEFINVDEISNIDGTNQADFTAQLEISISKDGVNYSDFTPFTNSDYIAKEFKFRVILKSLNPYITPFISALNILVDMPDIIESNSFISSKTGEINVTYNQDFSIAPKVQITIINAQSGDDAIVTNQTNKGFTIKILNKQNLSVKREFNYIAKGY